MHIEGSHFFCGAIYPKANFVHSFFFKKCWPPSNNSHPRLIGFCMENQGLWTLKNGFTARGSNRKIDTHIALFLIEYELDTKNNFW